MEALDRIEDLLSGLHGIETIAIMHQIQLLRTQIKFLEAQIEHQKRQLAGVQMKLKETLAAIGEEDTVKIPR